MLEIRKFIAEDANVLCPTAIDGSLHNIPGLWKKWAKVNEVAGPAYTVLNEVGEPIVAGGVRLVREGIGNVWMVVSPKAKDCKKSVLRAIKMMLPILIDEFGLKKLRTDSRKGFAASQRLLEHLGFKRLRKETKNSYFYILEV